MFKFDDFYVIFNENYMLFVKIALLGYLSKKLWKTWILKNFCVNKHKVFLESGKMRCFWSFLTISNKKNHKI